MSVKINKTNTHSNTVKVARFQLNGVYCGQYAATHKIMAYVTNILRITIYQVYSITSH
uniref:Uncharacterized protein n=1 Tax=Anguilla anguilla TaxID=7936 RepID=A0A0E9QX50_ANGAN